MHMHTITAHTHTHAAIHKQYTHIHNTPTHITHRHSKQASTETATYLEL